MGDYGGKAKPSAANVVMIGDRGPDISEGLMGVKAPP